MRYFIALLFIGSSIIASASSVADSSRINQLYIAIAGLDEIDDHCEVPCGIYGDSLRIALIDEHIRTVEKASNQIIKLSAEATPNYNQLVRWITNKEEHAEKIQEIVSQYFLHQRIKINTAMDGKAEAKYFDQLKHLHHILVYAMKTKQGTDLNNIAKLKAAVEGFEDVYFHKHPHSH